MTAPSSRISTTVLATRSAAYPLAISSTAWVRLNDNAAIEMRPTSSVRSAD